MARHILNLSAFLAMFGTGMIMAILPQRIIQLSTSVSSVGELASAFALTFVLAQIPMGYLSDRLGVKPFMVIGYFICAGTGLIYYFSTSATPILLGRMLQGVGEVPVWSLAPALLALEYPDQKGKFMGYYNAAMHCGLTAGSLSGIWTAGLWQGNEAFLLFSGTSFTAGLLMALFLRGPAQDRGRSRMMITPCKEKTNKKELLALITRPDRMIVYSGILLYGAGYGIFITLIPGFLISVRQADQAVVGSFFVLFYMAVGFSQAAAGRISDGWGRKPVMILGLAMAGTGLMWFSGSGQAPALILLTLAAFGLGTYCVAALAFLNEGTQDRFKGTISGCFYFFWGMGYFCGPLLMGLLVKQASGQPELWFTGFHLMAGMFLIQMAAIFFLLNRPVKGRIKSVDL